MLSMSVYLEMIQSLKEARERIHEDALEADGEAVTPLICKRLDSVIAAAESWIK